MIRYLEQNEKQRTRVMYEANFPEDSEQFIDYYYEWKSKDNQILVMEGSGGGFQVMLHLNPYEFRMYGETVRLNYIVAVATDAFVRKQGKMAEVMKCVLMDMAKEHQPFTFLIPENPKVYLSSGFAFVPSENYGAYRRQVAETVEEQTLQAAEVTQEQIKNTTDIYLQEAVTEDIPVITAFANNMLGQEYNIFPFRTTNYYLRMLAELKSENGALMLLKQQEQLIGIFSYGKEGEKIEIQEILMHPNYRGQFGEVVKEFFKGCHINITEMDYMVRILDLKALGLLLRSEEPFSLKVQVQDDMIEPNNGFFEIKADTAGSSISAIASEEAGCSMDIAQLTEFLFGKMRLFIREWV